MANSTVISEVFDYSTTPGNNTDTPPNGWPEGMDRADVNNSARQMMSAVIELCHDLPWLELNRDQTIVRNSDTEFQVNGANYTSIYLANRQLRFTGSSTVYGHVVSSVFSTNTTVTVLIDAPGTALPTTLTEVGISVLDGNSGYSLTTDFAASAFSIPALGSNLVRDSGFEAQGNLDEWDVENGGATGWSVTTDPRAGAKSATFDVSDQTGMAYLRANSATATSVTNQAEAREGEWFVMGFAAKTTAGGSAVVQNCIEYYDEAGNLLGTDANTAFQPAGSYTEYSFVAGPAPTDTVYIVPKIVIASGSPAGTFYVFDDLYCRLIGGVKTALVPIASATSIELTGRTDVYSITGTDEIQTITGGFVGQRVTLKFAGALTLTDTTGNLSLRGADVSVLANDTIDLIYDGTNWYETSRTTNVPPTVTAADPLVVPNVPTIYLTGTTAFDDITVTYEGHILTIQKITDTVAVTTGTGNLRLNGSFASFGADDSLVLYCDGTNWTEITRANN